MPRRPGLEIFVLLFAWNGGARAAIVSPHPESVTVSIYHDAPVDTASLSQSQERWMRAEGLALISETRSIDLPAGESEIQFRGVAGTMVPQTAEVTGLPDGPIERNFDYDLLSPGALLAKSVGQSVHVIRTDRHSGKSVDEPAIVRSGPDGAVLEIGGRFEALHCSGLPERLVFERVPDGLIDTPTLTVKTNAAKAGHYIVTLRYLATGLNWSADYVARVAADDRTLDLVGWITLANFADTGFSHAPVDVIAGHLQTTGEDRPPEEAALRISDACWPLHPAWWNQSVPALMAMAAPPPAPAMVETVTVSGAKREIAARNLGDYKLYSLPEPTDVAARQTKQVQFLDRSAVPFERVYTARLAADTRAIEPDKALPAAVLLRLQNTARGGLGAPLPAGSIAAMATAPDGGAILAGQSRLDDVAVGLPLEISAGRTGEVWTEARVVQTVPLTGGKHERDMLEVTVTNQKSVGVSYELRQAMGEDGMALISESRPHADRNGDLMWAFTLAPGAQTVLRYTLDVPR